MNRAIEAIDKNDPDMASLILKEGIRDRRYKDGWP